MQKTFSTLVLLNYEPEKWQVPIYLRDYDVVDVLSSPFSASPSLRTLRTLKATLKALSIYRRYDLIFTPTIANVLPLVILNTLMRRKKPKIVAIDISVSRVPRFLKYALRPLMRSVAKIICHTTTQRNWWIHDIWLPGSAIVFVPYGTYYEPKETDASSSDGYIFSAGRSSRDLRTLVEAARNLREKTIIVAGRDPMTGKTGLEGLRVPSNVEIRYEIPYPEYLELMRKSRLVVVPLKDESYAAGQTVLTDAMAMGKPIVVSKNAATVDYVEDGETGVFVKPGNSAELAEEIRMLLRDPILMRSLGTKARLAARTRFNACTMQETIYGVIQSLVP